MGKFDGILLASDFDNTLIYTEKALRTGTPVPPLSEKNRAALEYFMLEGGKFAVSTGRALTAFLQYADEVPMNAPGIVCNGAALYDFEKGEYLTIAMLDDHARARGHEILNRFPEAAVEAYHLDNTIYAVHPNEITRNHEHLTKVATSEAPSLLDVPLPLGKLLFEAKRNTLEQIVQFLTQRGWADDYELIFSASDLLEMTVKGATKGGMVQRLAQHLGIPLSRVYCAGDEANDLSMLSIAAEAFAPANCISAVRESGATIVSNAWEDAIADIISVLDERYS